MLLIFVVCKCFTFRRVHVLLKYFVFQYFEILKTNLSLGLGFKALSTVHVQLSTSSADDWSSEVCQVYIWLLSYKMAVWILFLGSVLLPLAAC